ncbi:hypothetical protein [Phaffia rhodozyma]|uniref:Uncharacterized protein n=1 Tax=Phaffia rhodozyma TaxID=264483 RepID=A0A0F7SHZ4_PHARH|nr:hypothetical protein [Phaffia rhodozyma]
MLVMFSFRVSCFSCSVPALCLEREGIKIGKRHVYRPTCLFATPLGLALHSSLAVLLDSQYASFHAPFNESFPLQGTSRLKRS